MIRMLETYYLDVDETLQNGTDAMTVSGNFAHLYFQKFWGNGQNMTYFLNHAFPVMQAGIGASADYITLENLSLIHIYYFSRKETVQSMMAVRFFYKTKRRKL